MANLVKACWFGSAVEFAFLKGLVVGFEYVVGFEADDHWSVGGFPEVLAVVFVLEDLDEVYGS